MNNNQKIKLWSEIMEEDDDKIEFDFDFFGDTYDEEEEEEEKEPPVDCSSGVTRETVICNWYYQNEKKVARIEKPSPSWLDLNRDRLRKKRREFKYIVN